MQRSFGAFPAVPKFFVAFMAAFMAPGGGAFPAVPKFFVALVANRISWMSMSALAIIAPAPSRLTTPRAWGEWWVGPIPSPFPHLDSEGSS